MVGVQDEQDVQGTLEHRMGAVFHFRGLEHHVQEVARVAQIIVGVRVRHAYGVPVREGGQRGSLCDETHDLVAAGLLFEDPLRFGIERRQRGHSAHEHAHRVRVVMEAVDELLDVLVDDGVVRDLEYPRVELRGRGELPVEQQIGGLEERALLRELLDRVAPVAENALVAVDERERAAAGRRVHEGGVIRHQPEIVVGCLDLAQFRGADCSVLNRELVALASAVVDDGEGVLRHYRILCAGGEKITYLGPL